MEHEVALDVLDDGRGFDPARLCDSAAGSGAEMTAPTAGGPELARAQPARTSAAGAGVATAELAPTRPAAMPAREKTVFPVTMPVDGPDAGAPAPAQGGGFGLIAMWQRIEGLAGTLRIESEPGAGTGISACIPAAPAAARG